MRCKTFLLSLLLLLAPAAHSFELFPMVDFLNDKGQQSERFFKVMNPTAQALPVEILVKKRLVKAEAAEQLEATDDFMVFPPQVLIPPGQTQTVKVKYIGAPVAESQSYRVIFSQLPIKDAANQSTIKMLFQIGALVFVSSDKTHQAVTAEISNNSQELFVTNSGTGVIALPQISFDAKSANKSYRWKWDDVKEKVELQFLAPSQSVRISLKELLPANERLTQVQATGF